MTNPNEPSYPSECNVRPGLTKREEFAKAAMQGLCANPDYLGGAESVAIDAVKQADLLIEELNKENKV